MKKYKFLILVYFHFWPGFLLSQSIWKNDYLIYATDQFSLVELSNGNFMTGLRGMTVVDVAGNILSQRSYKYPPMLFINSFSQTTNNRFVFHGGVIDTCNSISTLLPINMITDSVGRILSQVSYRIQAHCRNNPVNMNLNDDYGTLCVGRGETCNQCWTGDFYAIRTDSSLNIKWSKYYTGEWGWPSFGKQAPDGNFIIGLNLSPAGGSLLKIDSLGNTIWCKSYFRPQGYMADCVFESDGSCVIVGTTDSSSAKKLFILKVDSLGEVLWCKGVDSDYRLSAVNIIPTTDNNYLLLGTTNTSNNKIKTLLIKTDKNADTLWSRIHGAYNYIYTPKKIIQASDGGYLFGGDSQGIYPQGFTNVSFLYKADSLGNTTCNAVPAILYLYNLFPTDSNIVLLSDNNATTQMGHVVDTVRDPIPTYDDCLITDVANIPLPLNNFKVHPNPSTGIIYIYRKDAYTSDCYYSVFDNLGKLLIQKIFPYGNKDAEIDLSRYGKGIYLIKITEGIESITKKVVIE